MRNSTKKSLLIGLLSISSLFAGYALHQPAHATRPVTGPAQDEMPQFFTQPKDGTYVHPAPSQQLMP